MAELQSCTAHACMKQQQPQNASDCPRSHTVQSNTDNGIRGNATCLVMRQHTKQYHSRRNTKKSENKADRWVRYMVHILTGPWYV